MRVLPRTLAFCVCLIAAPSGAADDVNVLVDPSFEMTKEKDQFGLVFAKWGGWKYEGDCDFRVGQIAHSGKTSCLLVGRSTPKIRVRQYSSTSARATRYRITAPGCVDWTSRRELTMR